MDQLPADSDSILVDLTAISLTDLDLLDGSPLARCLQRLTEEIEDDLSIVAGFQSTL